MIGHFLLTLTDVEEDRALTHVLKPGPYCGGCLIGTITGAPELWLRVGATEANNVARRRDPYIPSGDTDSPSFYRRMSLGTRIGNRYDRLCDRFTAPRVNQAIRNRILSNRARRTLQSVETLAHAR